jgi:hypothetical protein
MGIVFLAAPQKLLFLMPEVDQQRLMESGPYRMIARIGGILLIFVCAPLNLIFGLLFFGLISMQ